MPGSRSTLKYLLAAGAIVAIAAWLAGRPGREPAAAHPAAEEGAAAPSPAAAEPSVTVRPQSDSAREFVAEHHLTPRAWEALRTMNDTWVALLKKTVADGREPDRMPIARVAAEHEAFIRRTLGTEALVDAYRAWVTALPNAAITFTAADGRVYAAKEFK